MVAFNLEKDSNPSPSNAKLQQQKLPRNHFILIIRLGIIKNNWESLRIMTHGDMIIPSIISIILIVP